MGEGDLSRLYSGLIRFALSLLRRPLWRPGSTPPAHLDGSMPGDFGFDPLGLGVSKERLGW